MTVRLLTTEELAQRFRTSPSTDRFWRHIGIGPGRTPTTAHGPPRTVSWPRHFKIVRTWCGLARTRRASDLGK
jgi:hypothetical protein